MSVGKTATMVDNSGSVSNSADYFSELKRELKREWPKNRIVRIVFHGHSVPAGYFKTPTIRKFDSYPMLVYRRLCEHYPTASIDVCTTAIGGEHSQSGMRRFAKDVLGMQPDVVFIDYCLNDRRLGVAVAKEHWRKMIQKAVEKGVLVVLLTATPDSNEDILDPTAPLALHANSIRQLSEEFKIPLVDSYALFKKQVAEGVEVTEFLSQPNHPNRKGHEIVTEAILELLE